MLGALTVKGCNRKKAVRHRVVMEVSDYQPQCERVFTSLCSDWSDHR